MSVNFALALLTALLLLPNAATFTIYRRFAFSSAVDRYTLVVRRETLLGHSRPQLTVNGSTPGPVLITTLGNELQVTVINEVYDDAISIHWHGMSLRGTPQMDGVVNVTQCPISNVPGYNTFVYTFRPDLPGTYWYHGHMHSQYPDGLYGVFVVQDPWEREQWSARFNLSYELDGAEAIGAQYLNRIHGNYFDDSEKEIMNGSANVSNNVMGAVGFELPMDTTTGYVPGDGSFIDEGFRDAAGDNVLFPALAEKVRRGSIRRLQSRNPAEGGAGWGVLQVADYFLTEARLLEEAFIKPGTFALDPVPDAIIVNNMFSMPSTPVLPPLVLSLSSNTQSSSSAASPTTLRLRLLNAAAYSPYCFTLHLGPPSPPATTFPPSSPSPTLAAPSLSSLSAALPFYLLELDGPPVEPLLIRNLTLFPAQRASVLLDLPLLLQGEAAGWRTLYVTFTLQPQIYPTYDPHSPPQHNMFGSTSRQPLDFRWTAPWHVFLPTAMPSCDLSNSSTAVPVHVIGDVNVMGAKPLYRPPRPPPAPRLRINIRTSFYLDSDGVVRAYVNEASMGEVQGITPFPPAPPSLYALLGEEPSAPAKSTAHMPSLTGAYKNALAPLPSLHNNSSLFFLHHSPSSSPDTVQPQSLQPLPFWHTSLPLVEGSGASPFVLPPASSLATEGDEDEVEEGDGGYMVEMLVDGHCCGAHPFHLHGHHLLLLASNEMAQGRDGPLTPTGADNRNRRLEEQIVEWEDGENTYAPYPPYPEGGYLPRDVVTVPFGGWVLLRWWRSAGGVGIWPFHCHLHWHMSIGLSVMLVEQPEAGITESSVHISLDHLHMCQSPIAKIFSEGSWGVDVGENQTQMPSEFPSLSPTLHVADASIPTRTPCSPSPHPTPSHNTIPSIVPTVITNTPSFSSNIGVSNLPSVLSPSLLPSITQSSVPTQCPSHETDASPPPTALLFVAPSLLLLSHLPSVAPSDIPFSRSKSPTASTSLASESPTSLIASEVPSQLPSLSASLLVASLSPSHAPSPTPTSVSDSSTEVPSFVPSFLNSMLPSTVVTTLSLPNPSFIPTPVASATVTHLQTATREPSTSPSLDPLPSLFYPSQSPSMESTIKTSSLPPSFHTPPSSSIPTAVVTTGPASLLLLYTLDVNILTTSESTNLTASLLPLLGRGLVAAVRSNQEVVMGHQGHTIIFFKLHNLVMLVPTSASRPFAGMKMQNTGGPDFYFRGSIVAEYIGFLDSSILLAQCATALEHGVESGEILKTVFAYSVEKGLNITCCGSVQSSRVEVIDDFRRSVSDSIGEGWWGRSPTFTIALICFGAVVGLLAIKGWAYVLAGRDLKLEDVESKEKVKPRGCWGRYVDDVEASFETTI